jgi:hypothetical protein
MHNIKQADSVITESSSGNSRGKLNEAKGDHQDRVHSYQMVLVILRREDRTA